MKNLFILFGLLFTLPVFSSTDDTLAVRPFQISFISPMGSNGLESGNYVNRVSINIIAGISKGTDGIEAAGFVNVDKEHVRGGQFAGFANIIGKDLKGIQAAGYFNAVNGKVDGAQFSGFANYAGDSIRGVQIAGFANMSKGGFRGGEVAGFHNLALNNSTGIQIAGFHNSVTGNLRGTQLAGFGNSVTDSIQGGQIAGYVNFARNVKGIQAAGYVNIATKNMEGAQISGFVNVAKRIKGVQVSFVNIADTLEGQAFGVFSYSRNGYHKIEVKGSEALHVTASFKTGTSRFYNIFTTGVTFGEQFRWAYGYGLGTAVPLSPKWFVNFDLTAHHINEYEVLTWKVNMLGRLDANFSYKAGKRIEVFFGPAYNILVSRYEDSENNVLGSELAPYSFYDYTGYKNTRIKMWAGGSAGVRF
jgi:hypothetical protein